MGELTQLIANARGGDREALQRLFGVLYPDLRAIAHRRLARHARDGIVDTTARHLPIVDPAGRVLGVFSARDALRAR